MCCGKSSASHHRHKKSNSTLRVHKKARHSYHYENYESTIPVTEDIDDHDHDYYHHYHNTANETVVVEDNNNQAAKNQVLSGGIIHSKSSDVNFVLVQIFTYLVDDDTALRNVRSTCRNFRDHIDHCVRELTVGLIGPRITPIFDQTPLQLYYAAKKLEDNEEVRRKWLIPWEPDEDLVKEGFQVGLLNQNMMNRYWNTSINAQKHKEKIIAKIPCYRHRRRYHGNGDTAVGASADANESSTRCFIPVVILLDHGHIDRKQSIDETNTNAAGDDVDFDINGNLTAGEDASVRYYNLSVLPPKFLHIYAYPSGLLVDCNKVKCYVKETSLNDTLRRIQRTICHNQPGEEYYPSCPHNSAAYNLFRLNSDLYYDYLWKCIQLFQDYTLSNSGGIPNLDIVDMAAQSKFEIAKQRQQLRQCVVVPSS